MKVLTAADSLADNLVKLTSAPADPRLLNEALAHPGMWLPFAKLAIARFMGLGKVVLTRHGVGLEVGTGNGEGAWCGIAGWHYEPEFLPWLNLIQPGWVIVDIGANIGCFSIHAAKRTGTGGRVLAFEAMPVTAERLRGNIQRNELTNVQVIVMAVGDSPGTARLSYGNRQASASILGRENSHAAEVPMTTIDAQVEQLSLARLDLVKMDVEGAEPLVVKGMLKSIKRFKPIILFENAEGGGETSALLQAEGYEIGLFDLAGRWQTTIHGGNLFARPKIRG